MNSKIKNLLLILSILLFSCALDKKGKNTIKENEFVPPIMGWASWNNYRVNINEDIIKSQADAMVNLGLTKYGYQYINIDDGFFGGRDEHGSIKSHPKRFPSGMKSLADYIHSKCLKAGIYTDAGINTCASYWDKDTIGVGMGLWGHDEQDLQLFLKEWDYDFLKVDWCGGDWLKLDEEIRYTEIATKVRTIKPETVFNVCRWKFPGKWVTKIADSWRVSGDIGNQFKSVLNSIDKNADLWMYCSAGHYNDMDMLQIGRGMTYEEDKAHFTMWCLMNSPLVLGNDLTDISEQTLKIITNQELIDINQSPYVYQARRIIDNDSIEVWGRPLTFTMSGEIVVALLNRTTTNQKYEVNMGKIGISADKGYTVKDLWSKEEFPISRDSMITKEIPPHGVVVLKLEGTSKPYNCYQYTDMK